MLRTLLESRSRRTGNGTGTAASAGVHLTLIVLAAYATAAGAAAKTHDPPTELHWIRPQQPVSTTTIIRHVAAAGAPSRGRTLPHSLSFDIPVGIPDVSIPLAVVRQGDFVSPGEPLSSGYENGAPAIQPGKIVYDSREVERQVAAVAGIAPEYPASLRAAGIEGEVRAQFVVAESGRADIGSLRILSSTNDLFAEAVKRALPKMKFIPARIGSHAVAQMVQQSFVFRLDR